MPRVLRRASRWHGICSNRAEGNAMEETAYVWGTLSTVGGLLVAVGLSGLALWLVKRARDGNRRVREARRDPHVRN
jgi:NO-binding membrane sensor protein with MHYT domain